MKVVLAGAQSKNAMEDLLWAGTPNVLVSYEYLKDQKNKGIEVLKTFKSAERWILVDSGAFTFKVKYKFLNSAYFDTDTFPPKPKASFEQQSVDQIVEYFKEQQIPFDPRTQWEQAKEYAIQDVTNYFLEHLDWIKQAAPYANAFAELDVEWLIGDTIWQWRDQYKKVLDENNPDAELICTPHIYNSDEDLKNIATKITRYIGSDFLNARKDSRLWTTQMPILKEHRIRVHGWALTGHISMRELPFYSIDSTTWLGGAKYGTTYHYRGNWDIVTYDHTRKVENRQQFKGFCKEHEIDFDQFIADHIPTVNRFNAKMWTLCAIDLERDVSRAYWLSEEELQNAISTQRSEFGLDKPLEVRHRLDLISPEEARLQSINYTRMCNACFLNTKCPVFKKDATCSIDTGISIDNKDAMMQLLNKVIELQGQRVMFGVFAERIQGGVIDPMVGKELSLLFKLGEQAKAIEQENTTATISFSSGEKKPAGGILSQLFGGYGRNGGGGSKPSQSEKVIDVQPIEQLEFQELKQIENQVVIRSKPDNEK